MNWRRTAAVLLIFGMLAVAGGALAAQDAANRRRVCLFSSGAGWCS